ncbi:hypothetical protein [Peribacillus butanolivorans]|uniref:hypothetical protein n=1 Tax=Peribacillus butanolivorans TaxID=421767 RepID=UPI0035E2E8C2
MEGVYLFGEGWLDQLREYLQKNLEYTKNYFEQFIPQIKVVKLEGTYLVWLDCRDLGLTVQELDALCCTMRKSRKTKDILLAREGGSQAYEYCLSKWRLATISLAKTDLRIAFSCVELTDHDQLFELIYRSCKELNL